MNTDSTASTAAERLQGATDGPEGARDHPEVRDRLHDLQSGPEDAQAVEREPGARDDEIDEQDPDDERDVRKLRAEAAARRRELRDVEAERDQLRSTITEYQWAEVARLAADVLVDGSDVLESALGGCTLPELLDERGAVDREAVERAAQVVAHRRPALAVQYPDLGQGRSAPPTPEGATWGAVLRRG